MWLNFFCTNHRSYNTTTSGKHLDHNSGKDQDSNTGDDYFYNKNGNNGHNYSSDDNSGTESYYKGSAISSVDVGRDNLSSSISPCDIKQPYFYIHAIALIVNML